MFHSGRHFGTLYRSSYLVPNATVFSGFHVVLPTIQIGVTSVLLCLPQSIKINEYNFVFLYWFETRPSHLGTVFESSVLSRLFGPQGKARGWKTLRNYLYTVHQIQYYWGNQNIENETSGACSMCGRGQNNNNNNNFNWSVTWWHWLLMHVHKYEIRN